MTHWSYAYLGIPHLDRGRDRHGCDCWGLARLVYRECLGIDLPSYAEAYVSAGEQAEVAALIAGGIDAAGSPWEQVALPMPYDLVLFREGRHDSHVGIIAARGRFLHVPGHGSSCIEPLSGLTWSRRLRGIYRHRLAPASD